MSEVEDAVVEEEEVAAVDAPQEVGLSLVDIANAVNFIDVMSQRGAVKGEELEMVGSFRNRLAAFVQASSPPQTDDAEAPTADEPAAE